MIGLFALAGPAPAATAETLFNQFDPASPASTSSQDFETMFDTSDTLTVDDFQVPAGQTWQLDSALIRGVDIGGGSTSTVNLTVFADAAGTPGAPLVSGPVTASDYPNFNIPLTTVPALGPGTYWLGVQAVMNGVDPDPMLRRQWFWRDNDEGSFGNPAMFRNPGGAIVASCPSFQVRSTCLPSHTSHDQSFILIGTSSAIPPPPPPPPPADTTPPQTSIARHSHNLRLRKRSRTVRTTFRFSSNETGSTYTCKLDRTRARSCRSPYTLRLRQGRHTLSVFARDRAGNVDRSPARVTVRVLGARH